MLTQYQLSQLAELEKHPIYGKLLTKAIQSWKDNKPDRHLFGVHINEIGYVQSLTKRICLISASILGEYAGDHKPKNAEDLESIWIILAMSKYKLTKNQIEGLLDGFDGLSTLKKFTR
jgi:hypothetical protein